MKSESYSYSDSEMTCSGLETEQIRYRETNKVPHLYFPLLEETGLIRQAFSTRLGGVSTGDLASMNFAINRGDDPANVRENYHRMAGALGISEDHFVLSQQTHTTNLRVVTEVDAGKGVTRERDYTDIDGLLTDVPGLVLVTSFADCVPLYFLDPVKKAIALSHSGWRGTAGQIGRKTVEKMTEVYHSRPEDILACVGPSICQDCYEVSADVAEQFQEMFPEDEWNAIMIQKSNEKYQLDLWEINRRILLSAGILPEHLAVAGLCTSCHKDLLFSHRATGGRRGNLCAFLGLLSN